VHMASLGHPLLGDMVYGPKKCPFPHLQGQTLHAICTRIWCVRPVSSSHWI
ncbi:RNA pseudouridine synthase, partial [Clostridium sp. SL.3.18]|nr:RNA pseudouridine synthase [Clostridium sp. SL.3.18]